MALAQLPTPLITVDTPATIWTSSDANSVPISASKSAGDGGGWVGHGVDAAEHIWK